MRYMVIETFRPGAVAAVYSRFHEKGRMMPDGLVYVNSWVSDDLARCFQIMECDDPGLLEVWTDNWRDLVDFEIVPVIDGAEAADRVGA